MRIALAVQVSIAIQGVLACAPSLAVESPWDAERHIAAVQALETDSSLEEDEHALAAAGLAHSFPHSPVYAPSIAIQRFTELLDLHPRSPYRPIADHLIPHLEATTSLQGELRAQRQRFDEVLDRLAEHDSRVRQMEDEITRAEDQVDFYREIVANLRHEVEIRGQRIQELEETLEGLMQIDLTPSD